MTELGATLHRTWGAFVGPEATRTNHALTALTTAAGALTAPITARAHGADAGRATIAGLMAVDLAGGVYVNNTRACARWYERPGQGNSQHYAFAACHMHPAAVAWLDASPPRRGTTWRAHPAAWAAAHYAYMATATVLIRRHPAQRRLLAAALTAGGLALDRLLGPSHTAPWFAWAYYPKLLLGHAGAALWSDHELGPHQERA
ncbi:hypothetical protein AB0I66_34985 [Streptomyces sp. NPDC050439]|uniref:hypothetical protein n=1 Tax=unclassified Streptomyces TaxID=2593676 RepID=UPI00342E356F